MKAIVLSSRPVGTPTLANFEFREYTGNREPLPVGSIRVRPRWFSVDPYMRGRMNDAPSYISPFQVGEPITSEAIAEVIESSTDAYDVGELVRTHLPWAEESTVEARLTTKIPNGDLSPTVYLGALGMPGLTSYVGLFTVGALKPEDIVFISGAAGAVGSLASQIAKVNGNYVIGSVGSNEKVNQLEALGIDAVFNYRETDPRQALRLLAPTGIDLYFDNVGGSHLEAAIASLRTFGKVSLCGAISQYNSDTTVPGPSNFEGNVITKRLRVEGFIVSDHRDVREEFEENMTKWISSGRVKVLETVLMGFDKLPEAFLGLFKGTNMGKMLVQV